MEKSILKYGTVIDPSQKLHDKLDVLIIDGKVAKIEKDIEESDAEIIDCKGLFIAPGLIDMHVHLRDPGQCYKEDIISGCESACAGGVTAVCCMPNTKPTIDSTETINYILEKAKNAKARVYPVCSITKGLEGKEFSDFEALKKSGAIGASDDGRPVKNAKMMEEAILKCKEAGILAISHCEDLDIIDGGIINKGEVSERLGVKGMDRASEETITAREIILAEAVDAKIHIAHVSTKGSVQLIREAKARGAKVSCETGPHYFALTDELLLKRDADYRMNPPLRLESDRIAILEGLKDGTIDAIATDHAPHSAEEKSDFLKSPNGIVGLETSLAVSITMLCKKEGLPIDFVIDKMSCSPARLLNIQGGTLKEGATADICVFDMDKKWTVDVNKFKSKSRNSAFKGMELTGKVIYTILGGKVVYNNNKN